MKSMIENNIIAGTCLVKDFFSFFKDHNIKIPDYQRPYVWNPEKIQTLINDLEEHIETGNTEYYMGSILLFFDKFDENYEVIDGQQRLTSILILDYITNEEQSILYQNKDSIQFSFNSPISKKNIVDVKQYLNTYKKEWLKSNWNNVFSNLIFSVIVTHNQDDAFSFFETQNYRGVKLSSIDYLKSYHLRELNKDIENQKRFTEKWDLNNTNQFLEPLFNQVIWRGRSWQGWNIEFETLDDILFEFQKKTLKPKEKKQNSYLSQFKQQNN